MGRARRFGVCYLAYRTHLNVGSADARAVLSPSPPTRRPRASGLRGSSRPGWKSSNQNFQTVAGCILTVALLRVASTYLRAVPHDLLQLLDRTAVQDPLTRERMPRGLVPRQGRKSARGLGAPLQEPPQ